MVYQIKGVRKGMRGTVLKSLKDDLFSVSVETVFGNRTRTVFHANELKADDTIFLEIPKKTTIKTSELVSLFFQIPNAEEFANEVEKRSEFSKNQAIKIHLAMQNVKKTTEEIWLNK